MSVSTKPAAHRDVVAIAMAAPRTRLGKILESSTQVIGANVIAYTAIGRYNKQQHDHSVSVHGIAISQTSIERRKSRANP